MSSTRLHDGRLAVDLLPTPAACSVWIWLFSTVRPWPWMLAVTRTAEIAGEGPQADDVGSSWRGAPGGNIHRGVGFPWATTPVWRRRRGGPGSVSPRLPRRNRTPATRRRLRIQIA